MLNNFLKIIFILFFSSLVGCSTTIDGIREDLSQMGALAREVGMGKSCQDLPSGRLCWSKKAGCLKDATRQLTESDGSLSHVKEDECPSSEADATCIDEGMAVICYSSLGGSGCRDATKRTLQWEGSTKIVDISGTEGAPNCSIIGQ